MKGCTAVNIGFGNFVIAEKIFAIVDPLSLPIKRLIREARKRGLLVDASKRKRARSAIFVEGGHIVLSPLSPQALARRLGATITEGEEEK